MVVWIILLGLRDGSPAFPCERMSGCGMQGSGAEEISETVRPKCRVVLQPTEIRFPECRVVLHPDRNTFHPLEDNANHVKLTPDVRFT